MMGKLTDSVVCWFNGWRTDLDGWLVRAKRAGDPEQFDCEIGFVEESAIAVRTPTIARLIDRREALSQAKEGTE